MKKKLAIIGQFPPPIHGLSQALKILVESKKIKNTYNISTHNITRVSDLIKSIIGLFLKKKQKAYLTISHSKIGNIRDLFLIFLLLFRKNEVILHYHGGNYKNLYKNLSFLQKKMNQILLSRVSKIIVLGKSQQNLFTDVIDQKKIFTCENFAENAVFNSDNDYFKSISEKQNTKKIKLIYLSNLIEGKGYKEVIEAFKLLEDQFPDKYELHIAGGFYDKDSKKIIKNMLMDFRYNQKFYYHGIVNGLIKNELLKKSDIFILPTYMVEGQPISVIEAMANGLICVTTEIGGVKDVVHNQNNYFVKEKSAISIVNVIKKIDKYEVEKIGYLNREKAKKFFTEEMYIERLIEIIGD